MTQTITNGVYGAPLAVLADVPRGSAQFSPLVPGSAALEAQADGSLDSIVMQAPPGTIERRHAIASALRALKTHGAFTFLALKDKGGSRLAGDLKAFGVAFGETNQRHHRICTGNRPAVLTGIEQAIEAGAARRVEELGLWSQPGIFSWNRIDPGSEMLAASLPKLTGEGADLGCGIGYLTLRVLAMPSVTRMVLVDLDRRAVEAARRNIADARVDIRWADVRAMDALPTGLDFVIMNPPFHDGGYEDRALGQAFIRRAADILRAKGTLWMVANRHLPYEDVIGTTFAKIEMRAQNAFYKIYEARR